MGNKKSVDEILAQLRKEILADVKGVIAELVRAELQGALQQVAVTKVEETKTRTRVRDTFQTSVVSWRSLTYVPRGELWRLAIVMAREVLRRKITKETIDSIVKPLFGSMMNIVREKLAEMGYLRREEGGRYSITHDETKTRFKVYVKVSRKKGELVVDSINIEVWEKVKEVNVGEKIEQSEKETAKEVSE